MNDKIECRYCLSDENPEQLIDPCKCEGSMRFVHQKCMEGWIKNGNRNISQITIQNSKVYVMKCEICNYPMKYRQEFKNGIFKSLLETIKLIFKSWKRLGRFGIHMIILYYLNKRVALFIKECISLLNNPFNSESAMELIHNITIFISIVLALRDLYQYYNKLFYKMRVCSMIFMKRIKEEQV